MKIAKKIRVTNSLGLHLRAAAKLVSLVTKFNSEVTFRNTAYKANGKSILNLMALGAVKGAELEIELEGGDAAAAFTAISDFFENGFREKAPKVVRVPGMEMAQP